MEEISKYLKYNKKYRCTKEGRRRYEISKKKYYDKTAIYLPSRFNKKDDKLILAHDITDTELSKIIHHSVKSIQVRRSRLKNGRTDI